MERGFTLLLILTISCVHKGRSAQISTYPQNINIGGVSPTESLRIVCIPNAPGITSVQALEIGRRTTFGGKNAIVRIVMGNNNVVVADPSLQNRLTYAGSINGAQATLEMTLTQLQCSDAASTYYCTTNYVASEVSSDEANANITARVYPQDIRLTVSPDQTIYNNPPMTVRFECRGNIGNQFDSNMANFWRWEWRLRSDDFNSQWVSYPETSNIIYETPSASSNCQFRGGSTLTHQVTTADNGRDFRCYVIMAEYGGNRTIYTSDPSLPANGGAQSKMQMYGFISVLAAATISLFQFYW